MKKSAKYFLNNNGKKLLAASVMALLLSGSAQTVWAADLDGTVNGKLAEVNSGDVYSTVYGVLDYDNDGSNDDVFDGKINMYDGTAGNLYGGKSWEHRGENEPVSANGNYVNVYNGKVDWLVAGGQAQGHGAEASANIVNINGGEIAPQGSADYFTYAVSGGVAQAYGENNIAAANENRVNIIGGVINASVAGGFVLGDSNHGGNSGIANNNKVFIGGDAKIFGNIYGAMSEFKYESDNIEMNNNIVIIGGSAKVNGDIYGANAEFKTGDTTASMNNNMVIVSGNADISNAALHGIGSSGSSGGKISGSGNTLIINGWHGSVKTVDGFNNVVFKEVVWQDNGKVLNITDGENSSLKDAEIDASHIHFDDASDINDNDSMILIHAENDNNELSSSKIQSGNFTAGVAVEGDGEAKVENGDLVYQINGIHAAKQTKLVAENRAVAAAFINQGTDLISDSLDALSRDDSYGIKTFAAVQGNRSKYDVNSDIKINGWSTIVGAGNAEKFSGGDEFAWGVFYENGSGNYRTYNEFNDEFFRGDGSLVYNGGGVAARYENAHGVYTEGSLRAGMLKSEMDNALHDGSGAEYGYDSSSAYYGAHIGIGQVIQLSDDSSVDVYGKFFHTYTEGDNFSVGNDKFEFDSINSDRLRIGARVTTNKENKFITYYGLAYEYEFNGSAGMRAAGMEVPEQSLRGSSYMAEAGLNYQPSADSPWSFDLNMRGYAGERQGASFNVQATYTF